MLGSDVVAGSGESHPCEFTGLNLASMRQVKKCRGDKVLEVVVSGEFGLARNAGVHDIVVGGRKNCFSKTLAKRGPKVLVRGTNGPLHRYSTDAQRDASIEDQARICQERIRNEGWVYVGSYQDRAMSGASRLRPAYQKLLEDARRHHFDVVVAESLDRLSRDQEDVAHLYKQLTFAGVRLLTLSEGWISELHVGLSGTMGALYLKQLAEKTRRGLRGRVEAGRSGGGNSYGYDVVTKLDADGKTERGLRKKNEPQALIILGILTDYAAGKSPRSIAKDLNARGVLGPSGGTWSPSAINGNNGRGTGILNNELYVGRIVWNRLRYVKNLRQENESLDSTLPLNG